MPVLQIEKHIVQPSPSQKALELAQDKGYLCPQELARDYAFESVVPAICMTCDYSTDYEPDQNAGHCECCNTKTVKSILVLLNLI